MPSKGLGQVPSIAPAISGAQLTLTPNDDKLMKLSSQRRQSTEQIIPSMLSGLVLQKDANDIADMITCSENIRIDKDGSPRSLHRCRKRICPVCSSIESNKWSKRISEALEFIADDFIDEPTHHEHQDTKLVGLKVNLSFGERCNPEELGDIIKAMHKLWGRLLNIKAIKSISAGALRATEFKVKLIDGTPKLNPHIHGLILLKVTERPGADFFKTLENRIKSYWRERVLTAYKELKLKRIVSFAGQSIEPLYQHTSADAASWLTYATKGAIAGLADAVSGDDFGHQSEDLTELWMHVYRATKNMHLISASGDMKDHLAEAKARRALDRQQRKPDEVSESKPTHRWSYPKRRYLPSNEWLEHIDRAPNFYLVNFSHFNTPRSLFDLYHVMRERETIPTTKRIREYHKTGILLPKNKRV